MSLRFTTALVFGSLFVGIASAQDTFRNYGATDLVTTPAPLVSPAPAVIAGSSTIMSSDPAAVSVAFGHRRHCCGSGGGFPAAFNAYSTYQPGGYYPAYGSGYGGYYGTYGANYGSNYAYASPNPYGYYQNGQIWGSSGPTYMRPFPVWNSPSGVYDYRYRGWGSYGWGGWGGTGPAGWGYQGGFYW